MESSVVVQGNKGFIQLELCHEQHTQFGQHWYSFAEFGWDSKHAAVIVLFSRVIYLN